MSQPLPSAPMDPATLERTLKDRAVGFYQQLRTVWGNWWNRETARAYRTLTKAMKDDPQFATSWQCNIAMPIYDGAKGKLTIEEANTIADDLMRHLFEVEKFRPAPPS